MLKLLVLSAVVAAVSAAPGLLHHAVALPLATSHSSRIDIHSKPLVVATPIVHAPIVHAPIIKTYAPIVKHVIPGAISHSSRVEVHPAPIISYGHGWDGWNGGWNGGWKGGWDLGHSAWGGYGHGWW